MPSVEGVVEAGSDMLAYEYLPEPEMGRHFLVKLKLRYLNVFTRVYYRAFWKEFIVPADEAYVLNNSTWERCYNFLGIIEPSTFSWLVSCSKDMAKEMLDDPRNADKTVLVIHARLLYNDDSEQAREQYQQQQQMVEQAAEEEEEEAEVVCTVCLERMEVRSAACCWLPCTHVFHENCIERWMAVNPSCPLCRCQF